jgi:hypothetical protein
MCDICRPGSAAADFVYTSFFDNDLTGTDPRLLARAARKIRQAGPKTTELYLDGLGLTSLPDGLFDRLPRLRVFSCRGNSLPKLPSSIERCASLRIIDSRQNCFDGQLVAVSAGKNKPKSFGRSLYRMNALIQRVRNATLGARC